MAGCAVAAIAAGLLAVQSLRDDSASDLDDPTYDLWKLVRDDLSEGREPGPIDVQRYYGGLGWQGIPTFFRLPVALTPEDLKAGKVDVLIGTHRLLSKDVHFADLGLLVVGQVVAEVTALHAEGHVHVQGQARVVLEVVALPPPLEEGVEMRANVFGNQAYMEVEFDDYLRTTGIPLLYRARLVQQADETGGTGSFENSFREVGATVSATVSLVTNSRRYNDDTGRKTMPAVWLPATCPAVCM